MLILYEDLVKRILLLQNGTSAKAPFPHVCLQVSDPESECKKLFQLIGIGGAYIPAALAAMSKDSQGGQLSKRTHR